jgi:hypothetical protein
VAGDLVTRRALAAGLGVLLLAGCSLPLDDGVHSPGRVAADFVEDVDTQVLLPPPGPDAGARQIVEGFLDAQSSPGDRHAVAREYLHPDVADDWDERSGVEVYDPASRRLTVADEGTVRFDYEVVARIGPDGSWSLDSSSHSSTFRLRRDPAGQLRIVDVPAGLRLTPSGAARSFRPYDVHYVGLAGEDEPTQLVPDRVFLPEGADVGDAVVQRLLAGPSPSLRGAVTTGSPEGTELRSPVTTNDGVVTVDLTAPAGDASERQLEHLAAQLVWTLSGTGQAVTGVRVLVEGEPLEVDGAGELQERDDWEAYDPNGRLTRAAALHVEDRRLQRLDGSLPATEATSGQLPVDAVAASPADGRLALLSRTDPGAAVRTGRPSGPFNVVATLPDVSSMSWGSGQRGLWLVSGGEVLLVPDGGPARRVPVAAPDAGRLSVLRVSRDGARAAVVLGEGAQRRLYVGRVESTDAGPRIANLRAVAPQVTDVADVTWETGTTLVVLGQLGTTSRLLARVAVDGSRVDPVRTLGLDGEAQSVVAAPGRPLLVGAAIEGRPVLLVEEAGLFRIRPGSAPAYPG